MTNEDEAKEKRREYQRRYREANREKRAEATRRWREKNPDYNRRYYEANREYYQQHYQQHYQQYYRSNPERATGRYQRAKLRYNKAHPEAAAESRRRYNEANPEKVSAQQRRRRAKVAGVGGSHTEAEWQTLCSYYMDQCLSCGEIPDLLTRDHVVPITKGGSDDISNIQPLCAGCNSRKHTKIIDYR